MRVAAVSTGPEARSRRVKQAPVRSDRKRNIAGRRRDTRAAVVTGGLGCWSVFGEGSCSHQARCSGFPLIATARSLRRRKIDYYM